MYDNEADSVVLKTTELVEIISLNSCLTYIDAFLLIIKLCVIILMCCIEGNHGSA